MGFRIPFDLTFSRFGHFNVFVTFFVLFIFDYLLSNNVVKIIIR